MDEAEWLSGNDTYAMLRILGRKANDRKVRLFTCACCRSRWEELPDARSKNAVEVAESFADGIVSAQELEQAHQVASSVATHFLTLAQRSLEEAHGKERHFVKTAYALAGLVQAAEMAACRISHVYPYPWTIDCGGGLHAALSQEARAYASVFQGNNDLLRCISGNPFRPVTINPAWLAWNDWTIRRIAQSVYDERAFDRMPVLADALEDAGCDNTDILNHCRSKGPHVRGCWAVDLLLGKE